MAETGLFRGEGGHVWEMDLPLGEAHAKREREGALVRVNEDGSPFTESAEEPTEPAATQEPSKKPNKASSKADWVEWAVHQGADRDEAESLTLAVLIERYHGAE